jgi:hypothetical protein
VFQLVTVAGIFISMMILSTKKRVLFHHVIATPMAYHIKFTIAKTQLLWDLILPQGRLVSARRE